MDIEFGSTFLYRKKLRKFPYFGTKEFVCARFLKPLRPLKSNLASKGNQYRRGTTSSFQFDRPKNVEITGV